MSTLDTLANLTLREKVAYLFIAFVLGAAAMIVYFSRYEGVECYIRAKSPVLHCDRKVRQGTTEVVHVRPIVFKVQAYP